MKEVCKKVASIAVCIILIVFLSYVCYFKATDKMSIEGAKSSETVVFHINRHNNQVQISANPFADFLLDTGAALNCITDRTLGRFRDAGYEVEEFFYPVVTHDMYGSLSMSYKGYYVSIPVKSDKGGDLVIKNIRFHLSERFDILGQEFMKYFNVEVVSNKVYLRSEMPDGYDRKINLKRFNWAISDWSGRYYWDMVVDETEHRFYVDTGKYLDKLVLWLSAEECGVEIPEGERMKTDSITFSAGEFINQKVGCAYMENMVSPYAVNPLEIDGYDWVFDLSDDAMYYRPSRK